MKAEFANLEYIFRRTYCHVVPMYQRPARDRHVHQLGNLTLTTGRLNSQLSHSPWPTKREGLRPKSTLLLTTASVLTAPAGVLDNTDGWMTDWDESRISLRSRWLSDHAVRAWPRPEVSSFGPPGGG